MKIVPYINGRIIVTESQADEDLLIKFSTALAAYDIDNTPKVQRTKLKALWLKMEHAASEHIGISMGVKRSDIFECFSED